MDPWRYSTEGISVALRVTPRSGRDDIDGIEKRGEIVMGCNAMGFGNCLSRLAIAAENCGESDGIAFGGHRRLQVARPDASSDETKFRLRHNQS